MLDVGKLGYDVGNGAVEEASVPYCQFEAAAVITDRPTEPSEGFGDVEMSEARVASAAARLAEMLVPVTVDRGARSASRHCA